MDGQHSLLAGQFFDQEVLAAGNTKQLLPEYIGENHFFFLRHGYRSSLCFAVRDGLSRLSCMGVTLLPHRSMYSANSQIW